MAFEVPGFFLLHAYFKFRAELQCLCVPRRRRDLWGSPAWRNAVDPYILYIMMVGVEPT